jgi:tRNA pseudouridine32 synthase/23S rRNA pseudouridine746 synthase
MGAFRGFLGFVCHHPRTECRKLHPERDEPAVLAGDVGRRRDIDPSQRLFGAFRRGGHCLAGDIAGSVFVGKVGRRGVSCLDRDTGLARCGKAGDRLGAQRTARLSACAGTCDDKRKKRGRLSGRLYTIHSKGHARVGPDGRDHAHSPDADRAQLHGVYAAWGRNGQAGTRGGDESAFPACHGGVFCCIRGTSRGKCPPLTGQPMSAQYNPPDTPLDIVHYDHQILIANKPSGLLSVPGKGPELTDCLIARVQSAFPDALLVHRLDRDTSGVMVFALTPHAQRHIGLQFEKRQTKKVYIARVWGEITEKTGIVDLPLIVDWPNRPLQKVDHETGREAITEWRVMRARDGESRVRLMPKTGRSHQLRIHMREIGHPILGDPFYADGAALNYPRLMLHAEELRLRHPDGGRGMSFRAEVPF